MRPSATERARAAASPETGSGQKAAPQPALAPVTWLAYSLAAIAAASTVARLFFGADFIDESLTAATAYRFAMGGRPFLDEWDIHQTAALLVAPWVRLHMAIFGSAAGIMLSLRLLWAILNGAASLLSYRFLRRVVDRRLALLAAVGPFCLIPYMIPTPSFNALPVMLSSMAVSIICGGVLDEPRAPRPFVLGGVLLGLATFAYPTLVVVSVAAVLGIAVAARSWRPALWTLAGGAALAVAALALLGPFLRGVPQVLEFNRLIAVAYDWAGRRTGGIPAKVVDIAGRQLEWSLRHVAFWACAALAVSPLIARRFPAARAALAVVALVTLPILPLGVPVPGDKMALVFGIAALVSGSILAFARGGGSDSQAALRFAMVFGVVAGFVFGVTSSNGWLFLGLGGIAVAGPALAIVLREAARALGGVLAPRPAALVAVAGMGCVLGALVWFNATGNYRDLPPVQLTRWVRTGPHAGLITTPENAVATESLWKESRSWSADDRVLAYHAIPVAYLYGGRPALPVLWISSWDANGMPGATVVFLRALMQARDKPTIVVKNEGWPSAYTYAGLNPADYDTRLDGLEAWVRPRYKTAAKGSVWEVLEPVTPVPE